VGAATTILKGASQTSDPLTKLYQQLDRGTTVTQSERLYQGPNIVRTPYSTVRITLSKIKSVIDDEDLVGPYETIVSDAYNTLKLDDKQPADLAQGCRRFDGLMQNRNLSPDDISYGLVLLTRLAGFDQTKTLTCMGPDYAQSGLAHKALWKRYGYEKTPLYTEADAKAFFYSDDVNSKHPRPPHKEFAKIQTRLEFAMNGLASYALSYGQDKRAETYFTDEIYVVNYPNTPFGDATEGAVWTREKFLTNFVKKDPAAFRIACSTSDTLGDGLFLAFSANPKDQSTFIDDDAVALRVWLDGDGKIGWVTMDSTTDLIEKAVPTSRKCGKLIVTALPKPGEPASGSPPPQSDRKK
jgi:hypothetical protein